MIPFDDCVSGDKSASRRRFLNRGAGMLAVAAGAMLVPARQSLAKTVPARHGVAKPNQGSDPTVQHDWRWCDKCQGLFYAGISLGVCPAGGSHRVGGSTDYALLVWEGVADVSRNAT